CSSVVHSVIQGDGDSQVVPTITRVEEPVVVVFVFPWKEEHKTHQDTFHNLLQHQRNPGKAVQAGHTLHRDYRILIDVGFCQPGTKLSDDVLLEIAAQFHGNRIGFLEVHVPIVSSSHPAGESIGDVTALPCVAC